MESLRSWTYQQLVGLRHSNGSPLLRMFGAHEEGGDHQGGIFQFQVSPHFCWSQLGYLPEIANRSLCPAILRQLLAFLSPWCRSWQQMLTASRRRHAGCVCRSGT